MSKDTIGMDPVSIENWSSLTLQEVGRILSPTVTIQMSEVPALAKRLVEELASTKKALAQATAKRR